MMNDEGCGLAIISKLRRAFLAEQGYKTCEVSKTSQVWKDCFL